MAFESRKLIPAEMNYAPTELEMLAVHHCCKVFRCYIEGKRVILHTDHKPTMGLLSCERAAVFMEQVDLNRLPLTSAASGSLEESPG